MVPICGVCHSEESKYKCPVCEMRYCSLACYKIHKPSHPGEELSPITDPQHSQPKRDRPGTKQRVPKLDFREFENDVEFKRLLIRYPMLEPHLQVIYGLTLEPGPDEARTWNRQPLFGSQGPAHRDSRARGRGRGSRGGQGRGRGVFVRDEERQHGRWTQEKGDKEALTVMRRMREGSEQDEKAEGMREFITLCLMRFESEKETV